MDTHYVRTRATVTWTRAIRLFAVALLALAQLPYVAFSADNTNLPSTKDVVLNVTALDAKGRPVADLTCADFQIFDEGKPQHIAPCNLTADQPSTTLILWDLLNSIRGHREYTSSLLVRALQPLTAGDSVYLYLLTNHGDLYPVHALQTPRPPESGGTPWTQQVRPTLDQAIQKVYGLRPVDEQNEGIRAGETFHMLGELEKQLAEVPGPKTIVWITTGVSNWMLSPYGCQDLIFPGELGSYLAGKCSSDCAKWGGAEKCIDYSPFLRHFSAELARTGTNIYSVEETPSGGLPRADRGSAKDTLEQLTDLTGGRMYSRGEVEKAITQSLEGARARYKLVFDGAADGKYHNLRVTSTRKGVHVEAPRSYFADQR